MLIVKKKLVLSLVFMLTSSLFTYANAGNMKPPGNCSSKQHADLKSAVTSNCGGSKMKCLGTDSLATNKVTMNILQKCINSRKLISKTCFNGADSGHQEQIDIRQNSYDKCKNFK